MLYHVVSFSLSLAPNSSRHLGGYLSFLRLVISVTGHSCHLLAPQGLSPPAKDKEIGLLPEIDSVRYLPYPCLGQFGECLEGVARSFCSKGEELQRKVTKLLRSVPEEELERATDQVMQDGTAKPNLWVCICCVVFLVISAIERRCELNSESDCTRISRKHEPAHIGIDGDAMSYLLLLHVHVNCFLLRFPESQRS